MDRMTKEGKEFSAGQAPPVNGSACGAATVHDPRDPDHIEHTFLEMVRSRVFDILAGLLFS